jgi:integrase
VARSKYPGIYRHGQSWRVVVSQGRGRPPLRRSFPLETPLSELVAWRQDQQAEHRVQRKRRATIGTFAYDAKQRYLPAVTGLTTYATRETDIARWIALFGRRYRDTITSAEICAYRDQWAREPRGVDRDGQPLPPYAASTINHWLRALSNVWTVLDGPRAPNPVRDVAELPEPDALPRALSYDTIERILTAMPDRGRPVKGQKRPTVSLAKLRLRVLAYTGLTYRQLARLQPAHVDLRHGTMLVTRREKGKGAKPRRLPLLPQAVEAFKALQAARAWGPFDGNSVRRAFLRAAKRANVKGIRPYDLRHSLGTLIFRATGSREAVKEFLQHESIETTARYTLAAVDQVLTAQLARVKLPRMSSQRATARKRKA